MVGDGSVIGSQTRPERSDRNMMASLLSYTILFSVLYKPFTTAAATTTTYFLLYIIMWFAEVGYSL